MREELQLQLVRDTEELRQLVGEASTEAVVRYCAGFFLHRANNLDDTSDLTAPTKQVFFLLGLLLTTPEPDAPKSFGNPEWAVAKDLLNRILGVYGLMFWPTNEERPTITREWREVRMVAMPAFLHYFTSGLLATTGQVAQRIRAYLKPFDKEIQHELGISATDALEVCEWLGNDLQSAMDRLLVLSAEEERQRLTLLARAEKHRWSRARLRQAASESGYSAILEEMLEGPSTITTIRLDRLTTVFGTHKAHAFWAAFQPAEATATHYSISPKPTRLNDTH